MKVEDLVLQGGEKCMLLLRSLYLQNGYRPYRMSKFEEYDLYAKNKGFLVSDNVITFTDTNGRLMALKPDVTLSIIKNSKDLPEVTQRVCYNENVYRVTKDTNSFKEIMQTGIECFGKVESEDVYQVIVLAAQSMQLITDDWILELANLDAVLWQRLQKESFADNLRLTAKLDVDLNYYNGTIMKGYINGIPSPVLSGGQYDPLMEKMHRRSRAIGFAVYINLLERIGVEQKDDGYLKVAMPKGRLGDKVYGLFTRAGFGSPQYSDNSRKLFFDNDEKRIRYFWVKPSDVSKYVERGAADIGVAGADILREYSPEVDELQDLHLGVCRMVVAGPEDFEDDSAKTLRIATKFTNIANKYYQSKGRNIDIIKLHGSIEIAPLLGLSDVIVDIVETGTTLKENNLRVLEEVMPISARLIVNRSASKFKGRQIESIKNKLNEVVLEDRFQVSGLSQQGSVSKES